MNTRPGAYEIPAYRLGLLFWRKTTKPKEGK
jgi:hypothetical protein